MKEAGTRTFECTALDRTPEIIGRLKSSSSASRAGHLSTLAGGSVGFQLSEGSTGNDSFSVSALQRMSRIVRKAQNVSALCAQLVGSYLCEDNGHDGKRYAERHRPSMDAANGTCRNNRSPTRSAKQNGRKIASIDSGSRDGVCEGHEPQR